MTKPYPHMLVRNIDPEVHRQLRIWAVESRTSLARVIEGLVKQSAMAQQIIDGTAHTEKNDD